MMFGQTFSPLDIPRVAFLAVLEILLAADNAIILGTIVSQLPLTLRKRALFFGFLSAWVLRLVGILSIAYFLKDWWLQLVGGLYLLYLTVNHFIKKKKTSPLLPSPTPHFWQTVLIVECFDFAFAVDSMVAGLAFIKSPTQPQPLYPKLWIVYLGGMIGVFAIRYAAHFFSLVIQRYPRLETSAYEMVGWIGIKLCLQAFSLTFPYFEFVFWFGLLLFFSLGFIKRQSHV